MPAIGNLVLADAKPTPVNHTFSPVNIDGTVAKFANRAATIPQGFETLSIEMVTPSNPTAAYRMKMKSSFPTVATVDGQDVVVRNDSAEVILNFSQLSTAQDRKDRLKLVSGLLQLASVIAAAENLENFY